MKEAKNLSSSAWPDMVMSVLMCADAILGCLVHNAHRIELTGDSLRKRRKAEPAIASVAAVPRTRS
jgi:hypothetical protein